MAGWQRWKTCLIIRSFSLTFWRPKSCRMIDLLIEKSVKKGDLQDIIWQFNSFWNFAITGIERISEVWFGAAWILRNRVFFSKFRLNRWNCWYWSSFDIIREHSTIGTSWSIAAPFTIKIVVIRKNAFELFDSLLG